MVTVIFNIYPCQMRCLHDSIYSTLKSLKQPGCFRKVVIPFMKKDRYIIPKRFEISRHPERTVRLKVIGQILIKLLKAEVLGCICILKQLS